MRVAGVAVRPRNVLTPEDDATILNVSFASNIAEKHAIGVGYGAIMLAVAAVAASSVVGVDAVLGAAGGLGLGGIVTTIRAVRAGRLEGHLGDALREMAYTGLGAFLGLVHVKVVLLAAAVAGVGGVA